MDIQNKIDIYLNEGSGFKKGDKVKFTAKYIKDITKIDKKHAKAKSWRGTIKSVVHKTADIDWGKNGIGQAILHNIEHINKKDKFTKGIEKSNTSFWE